RLQPRYTAVVLALKTGTLLKDPESIDWDAVTALINAHERSERQLGGDSDSGNASAAATGKAMLARAEASQPRQLHIAAGAEAHRAQNGGREYRGSPRT